MSYLNIYKSTSSNPGHNLSLEEYLLDTHNPESADMHLVLYENFSSIILGRTLDCTREIYPHKKHPPVFRRSSGGGSVVHFPGNLNYGIIASSKAYPELASIPDSYRIFSQALAEFFPAHKKPVHKGHSDLSVFQNGDWKKVSGNAQRRRRTNILHHGTFIFHPEPLKKIRYFLQSPPKEPEYRRGRTHSQFLIRVPPVSSAALLTRLLQLGLASHFSLTLRQPPLPDFSPDIQKYLTLKCALDL